MKTQVRSVFVRNDTIENIKQIKEQERDGVWIGPPKLEGRTGLIQCKPGEIGVYEFEYSADGVIWRKGYRQIV